VGCGWAVSCGLRVSTSRGTRHVVPAQVQVLGPDIQQISDIYRRYMIYDMIPRRYACVEFRRSAALRCPRTHWGEQKLICCLLHVA
jgi:hypothetical protein